MYKLQGYNGQQKLQQSHDIHGPDMYTKNKFPLHI